MFNHSTSIKGKSKCKKPKTNKSTKQNSELSEHNTLQMDYINFLKNHYNDTSHESHATRKQINIALLGPVSAGKSTFMNTLFVEQFSDMKIKKTTMTPQLYFEMNDNDIDLDNMENIKKKNTEINQLLISKTETGNNLTSDDIKETKYYVPRIDKLLDDIMDDNVYLTVYDIPGLNDGATKELYFDYVNKNFYKFDMIIFIVDIHSALNTSDEIDILENIINGIKKNKEVYDIDNSLIVLANKCDDMYIENNKLLMDEEYTEMLQQINTICNNKIESIYPKLHDKYKVIPMSSEDAYIYRMFDKNPDIKLDIKYINKFGFNEYGKTRWNKLPENQKHIKINSLMKNIDIDERMEINGFGNFKSIFRKFLNKENQYYYLLNHLKYYINNVTNWEQIDITENIYKMYEIYNQFTELDKLFNKNKAISILNKYLDTYIETYHSSIIVKEINTINEHNMEQIENIKTYITRLTSYFHFNKKCNDYEREIIETINKFYVTGIESHTYNYKSTIDKFYKLVNNGYKNLCKLFSNIFNNNDILQQSPDEIISSINRLHKDKLISDEQRNENVIKIIYKIYTAIYTGQSMSYVDTNDKPLYVYECFNYWKDVNLSNYENVLSESQIKDIKKIKFYSYRNMVKYINVNDTINFNEISPTIEMYLINCIKTTKQLTKSSKQDDKKNTYDNTGDNAYDIDRDLEKALEFISDETMT